MKSRSPVLDFVTELLVTKFLNTMLLLCMRVVVKTLIIMYIRIRVRICVRTRTRIRPDP